MRPSALAKRAEARRAIAEDGSPPELELRLRGEEDDGMAVEVVVEDATTDPLEVGAVSPSPGEDVGTSGAPSLDEAIAGGASSPPLASSAGRAHDKKPDASKKQTRRAIPLTQEPSDAIVDDERNPGGKQRASGRRRGICTETLSPETEIVPG